ncbi:hypothetical protein Nepgr_025220 [Nepenthes gracilis]|uniref:Uncharacterized protein n=1 Tax=Nepenthes gracilis TaxID=150966 RepID=A0AAD3T620_NEPGR|nr:hypothetical protein Nepgr_025220 [Nepenthes gracilis]
MVERKNAMLWTADFRERQKRKSRDGVSCYLWREKEVPIVHCVGARGFVILQSLLSWTGEEDESEDRGGSDGGRFADGEDASFLPGFEWWRCYVVHLAGSLQCSDQPFRLRKRRFV